MMRWLLLCSLLLTFPAWAVDCVVAQYGEVQEDVDGEIVQVSGGPTANEQTVTFTSTSVQSSVLNGRTRYIGFICTAKTHFEIGPNASASTGNLWVPADTLLYVGVWRRGLRIAFVQGS